MRMILWRWRGRFGIRGGRRSEGRGLRGGRWWCRCEVRDSMCIILDNVAFLISSSFFLFCFLDRSKVFYTNFFKT